MIDHLKQLAIFAKTIDHGSFRAAAKELRLSPSVISHHVSQLEEHLGTALIYRSTRKLALTPEGERLLAAAHRMLGAVENELHALSSASSEPSGELRVTAPSVLSKSRFINMTAAFTSKYPRIRLALDFSDERRELIDDGFDIAVRMTIGSKRNSATRRNLFDAPRRLVAAPEYLQQVEEIADPQDLRHCRWLELTPVRSTQLKFRREGNETVQQIKEPFLSCNDAQALYRFALAGAGVAMIPEFLATDDEAEGRIRYVLPDWEIPSTTVFATWPANAPRNGLIKLFVSELSKQAAG